MVGFVVGYLCCMGAFAFWNRDADLHCWPVSQFLCVLVLIYGYVQEKRKNAKAPTPSQGPDAAPGGDGHNDDSDGLGPFGADFVLGYVGAMLAFALYNWGDDLEYWKAFISLSLFLLPLRFMIDRKEKARAQAPSPGPDAAPGQELPRPPR